MLLLHIIYARLELHYDGGIGRYVRWDWLKIVASQGWYGVDVFFILSGFLMVITAAPSLAQKPLASSALRYWFRRLCRIYPAYFASLVALGLLAVTGLPSGFSTDIRALPYHLTLTYGWWFYPMALDESWNLPGWSLSGEFFCYLLFPLFVWFIRSPLARPFAPSTPMSVFLCIFLLSLSLGLTSTFILGAPGMARALAGFLIGCCMASFVRVWPDSRKWDLVVVVAVVAMIVCVHWLGDIIPMFCSVPVAFGLLGLSVRPTDPAKPRVIDYVFSNRPILFLGTISYSVYIWHYPTLVVMEWAKGHYFPGVNEYLDKSDLAVAIALFVVISVIISVSTLSYQLIERPVHDWSKKFRRATAPGT